MLKKEKHSSFAYFLLYPSLFYFSVITLNYSFFSMFWHTLFFLVGVMSASTSTMLSTWCPPFLFVVHVVLSSTIYPLCDVFVFSLFTVFFSLYPRLFFILLCPMSLFHVLFLSSPPISFGPFHISLIYLQSYRLGKSLAGRIFLGSNSNVIFAMISH